jgi:tetratricopeptide (TPR) repeat protein
MADIPERFGAALSSRYHLEREIGSGGMATVYLARDLRHKRPVALKVMRPELGGREGVERFLQEIELAAGLQHPHILPVFDSGSIEGDGETPLPYFVMPFVEGETLRQRLQREGRLPLSAALVITGEVADALAYAHSHGVVHRDIKPENILLSGGHAVVADFGVAKALERGSGIEPAAGGAGITRAGIAVGTPLYMSPEQATGEAIDGRADQYSLGCVLFEMLVGEPPFTGPSNQSVIARSLSAPRPLVSRARPESPPELDQVVTRALALEPGDRYPDMNTFGEAVGATRGAPTRGARRLIAIGAVVALLLAAALGGWLGRRSRGSKVAPAAETLAVLPFHTSGPGVEFLGEGMMDLLATNLRGVAGIRTIDPRAVLRQWGAQRSGADDLARALAVGRTLHAGSVVLGSAVSTGDRVRVSADLYGIDGEQLGRAQVDGAADSVLSVVDRLSSALLKDVWRSREPLPNLRLASLTTDSIEALRSYLEGERYYRRLAWDSALGAYSRAVQADSSFALAYLRQAEVYGWTKGYGNKESHDAVAAGARFASRLPLRDRRLMLAYRLFDEGKPAAIDSLRALVASYPEDVEGWYLLGESMYHIQAYRPSPPESVSAVFDSVLRRDSTLFPALIHPLDLALLYRNRFQFTRYFARFQRTAAEPQVNALRVAAGEIWGPKPTDKELLAALRAQAAVIIQAAFSSYQRPEATSDTVLQLFNEVQDVTPRGTVFLSRSLGVRAHVLAGTGRWREARVLLDSLRNLEPRKAQGTEAWAVVLGLTPPSFGAVLDSVVKSMPAGPQAEYASGMLQLLRGHIPEGRRILARELTNRDSASVPDPIRGLIIAGEGWAQLLQGDSTGGIRRMQYGLNLSAAPHEESAFPRLQFALAMAARPDTRAEGIRWLRYGFETLPLYKPLTLLALGRTYEAAGQRDSAVAAYGRFVRLWDKADPELQERVTQAREALQELTAERPPTP